LHCSITPFSDFAEHRHAHQTLHELTPLH
jgi:hypothetical protein